MIADDERLNHKGSRSITVVWTEKTGDSFGRRSRERKGRR
uniref:Uncharacterized protein n=1 Tax=Cucumis melo TaxID=3656 RepID=A0A9I9CCI1_CUCME